MVLFAAIMTSCRKDFDFDVSSGDLRFSKDTVFLDTVFANISSSTYALTVYNDGDTDIAIPEIRLKNDASTYRLNVDGLSGNDFLNIPILANDSLYVFVETVLPQAEINGLEFLNTDAIQFIGSERIQEVQLVSLIKDAVFLYPQEDEDGMSETILLAMDEEGNELHIEGFYLEEDELLFTNEKPYVIYGYAAVPEGETLIIEAGVRVHFHKNSGIIVENGASLKVQGTLSEDAEALENEVIFEGDRLEPEFADIAGQWGTIWFFPESTYNHLENLTVKNATIGLFCQGMEDQTTNQYQLKNAQVFNSSSTNLWAQTANLKAENCIFGNAGQLSVYCNLGGTYDFRHCTISNYWTTSFRSTPALLIDNFFELEAGVFIEANLNQANFGNCIVDGNRFVELNLFETKNKNFNFNFKNCLIQFEDRNLDFVENPLYDFSNQVIYEEIGLNQELNFLNAIENDFRIQENSAAINFGDITISLLVPFDVLGNSREGISDVGAYNFTLEQL